MKTTFKNFEITAKLAKSGINFPNHPHNEGLHNQFKVTVKNTDTGGKTSFAFYASISDYEQGIEVMSENSLLHAFYCLLTDAESGHLHFDEFCGQFGYDSDSRKAHAIWNACKKQYPKVEKIEASDDLYELIDELSVLV